MHNLQTYVSSGAVAAVIAAVILAIAKFFGRFSGTIFLWISGTLQRNQEAESSYTTTLQANVAALQDRVTLLEKWRDEATQLESRVQALEQQLAETKAHYERELVERDAEITRLSEELAKAQADLAAAHAKIRRLEKQVGET